MYTILNCMGYHHETVCHLDHFIDPITGAHTQPINGIWSHLKIAHCRMRGVNRDKLYNHINEFVWSWNNTANNDMFGTFV